MPRLQGFQLVAGEYVPMTPEQTDRLSSGELGLDLAADAHLLRIVDPATGTFLPTREEYAEQLKRARRKARQAKREADSERRRSAALEAEIARLRALLPPGDAPS